MCERGVPGGAFNLNSTSYPDHGRCGDLSLQGKILTVEPEIEPGSSWLVVRSSDHQATMLVAVKYIIIIIIINAGARVQSPYPPNFATLHGSYLLYEESILFSASSGYC
jgi:hypothetical protein